jgi:hypothetical protein
MLRVEVGAVSVAVTVAEFVLVLVEVDVVVTVGVVRKYWEQALLMIGPPKAFRSPFRAGKSRRPRSSMLRFAAGVGSPHALPAELCVIVVVATIVVAVATVTVEVAVGARVTVLVSEV